ncbi:MAG: WG repeat-containing protein [Candidatus Helarchaeota archaeon]
MDIKKIKIAKDNSHHIFKNEPIYQKRFIYVLKYHQPGLAPVLDNTGAYHITVDGKAAYSKRFIKTFGFYYNKAAIITEKGWGHINSSGDFLYEPILAWTGNYQDNVCAVRDKLGNYYHINENGNRLYEEDILYAGDFRDGTAVVRKKNGLCTHIDKMGEEIHSKFFSDLDVFHKGFARARDENGWFHIDIYGNECYSNRYSQIEPFYNGFAHVEDLNGSKLIIDEQGKKIHTITGV